MSFSSLITVSISLNQLSSLLLQHGSTLYRISPKLVDKYTKWGQILLSLLREIWLSLRPFSQILALSKLDHRTNGCTNERTDVVCT
jgi:hypothetical protein